MYVLAEIPGILIQADLEAIFSGERYLCIINSGTIFQ